MKRPTEITEEWFHTLPDDEIAIIPEGIHQNVEPFTGIGNGKPACILFTFPTML